MDRDWQNKENLRSFLMMKQFSMKISETPSSFLKQFFYYDGEK